MKIGEYLVEGNNEKKVMAEGMIPELIRDRQVLVKTYEYQLEVIEELLIENRVLLKKYKNRKYEQTDFKVDLDKRKVQIEKEKIVAKSEITNPIRQEQIDKLKKFQLRKE